MEQVWNVKDILLEVFTKKNTGSNEVALEINKQKNTHALEKRLWNPVCWKY